MTNSKNNSNLFMFISILFCTCLLISNICAYKIISIGPFTITSGVLIFPITYIVNDLIAEVYGFQRAKKIIWFGFLMNLLMVLYFQLAIALPYPSYFEGQEAFSSVLGNSIRVLCASFSAYLVGSFMNAAVMSKMKVMNKGKHLMRRAVLSTLVGELMDSILFVTIAFAFVYTVEEILIMIATQTVLKTVYEIIIFPVTRIIINKVKKVENIDAFDVNIKYNPFSFKEESINGKI